jgi:hypothetical protein
MSDMEIISVTPENLSQFSLCGYKNPKKPGYTEKAHWLLSHLSDGLRMLVARAPDGTTQGMIEYVPGPACWRPIAAEDYMVIHCIFMGFRSEYKNKGFGGELVRRAENDAKILGLAGVAVVTRKGPFMADKDIFVKRGYVEADRAAPDFSLMVKAFRKSAPKAVFGPNVASPPEAFYNGLVIVRADQCPYSVANVKEMVRLAKADFRVTPKVIELSSAMEAQHSPCPFGTFGIFYRGKAVAHHPISATRFRNIMKAAAGKGK